MDSSLALQLQAIKAVVQAETEPLKRPYTRPSILFSPKEAADFDIETIYELGLAGLEVLGSKDDRFKSFVNDLFSHKSRETDRELLGKEDNSRIDASISSYLRLLSGYLQFRASLETLEYLIRRYKVHVYNVEDLVLCALPYHDTHAFVRIVQLLTTGNSKWKFLDGVKNSGAPLPRSVIVQQCIRDMQVMEALCDYASRTKKYQPSKPVINFSTAVVVGVLGSVTTVDGDIVKRILPFVDSGLQCGVKGCLDQQAGALMIVGMLASRAMLNNNLSKRLMRSIIDIAREHSKESSDPHWLRLSFMALINFVQLQSVDLIPKKALDVLKEIRDISGVLLGLSGEFIINRFLAVLLNSFLIHSSDNQCCEALASIVDTVPMCNLVGPLISKLFSLCMTQYQKNCDFTSSTSGSWAKKILVVVSKKYPDELRAAVPKFLEDTEVQPKKEDLKLEMLSSMLDGNSDMPQPFLDSKLWFGLHHPKASVRCAALSSLNGVIKADSSKAENLVAIQDAILRQLWDDDLAVVKAALSFEQLPDIVNSSGLLDALLHVVKRCLGILQSGLSRSVQLAVDVVTLSLKIAVSSFCNQAESTEKLTSVMFPFLLIQPKTWKLNLEVLILGKDVNWPLFKNLVADDGVKNLPNIMTGSISSISMDLINKLGEALSLDPNERRIELIESAYNFRLSERLETFRNIKLTEEESKKLQKGLLIRESVYLLNMNIINKLVEVFMTQPGDYRQWIIATCRDFTMSKTLFLMLLMHSLDRINSLSDPTQFLDIFELSFPILKTEWQDLEVAVDISVKELSKSNCQELLYQLFDTTDFAALNAKLLICLFWKLVETFIKHHVFSGINRRLSCGFEDLFFFFATTRSMHVFKEHLRYLVREANVCPVSFLSRLISEEDVPALVQIESLKCFSHLCSNRNSEWLIQIFSSFPVLLVPMSSDNQGLQGAAMDCIDELLDLWRHVDSSKKNGSAATCSSFYDTLLEMIGQQRMHIISDKKFLSSYLTSLLSSTPNDLLVPVGMPKRFDQTTKEQILSFILLCTKGLHAYGKLRVLSLFKDLGILLLRDDSVKSLLFQLLEKRSQYYFKLEKTSQPISDTEVNLLCLLLECSMMRSTSFKGQSLDDHILNALKMDCMSPEHPAVISPCLTILEKLSNQFYLELKTKNQIRLFHKLVLMFRSTNGSIQNAAKEAVLRLKISCSTVVHALDAVTELDTLIIGSLSKKKKQKKNVESCLEDDVNGGKVLKGETALCFIASVLDMLLLKKDLAHRESLIGPLFKLLGRSMSQEWVKNVVSAEETSIQSPQDTLEATHSSISSIQQTVLLILKDIFDSLNINPLKSDVEKEINVKMLVEFAHSSNDGVTRNHVFSLLTSVVKVVPDRVLDHIVSILTLLGESSVTQIDSHSKFIFEGFISSVIPCWLSKTNSEEQLLEIFVKVLPDITEHRRRSIVAYLLGIIGEQNGLPSLLALLFQSLISRKDSAWLINAQASQSFTSIVQREWEYAFAVQICEQYSSSIWLSSLVTLLRNIIEESSSKYSFFQMRLVLEFIFQKLQDPEFAFAMSLEPRNNVTDGIQQTLEELMKGCILLLQAVDATKEKDKTSAVRKGIKVVINDVLMTITTALDLSIYFRVITNLLQQQSDSNGMKKVLGLLTEKAKDNTSYNLKHKRRLFKQKRGNPWLNLDEAAVESFGMMCEEIVRLIDKPDDESRVPAKRAAVYTLEVLAGRFPSGHPIFSKCLASVAEGITSKNLGVSSSCLRTTAALINVLGPKALGELPRITNNLMKQSSRSGGNATTDEQLLELSVLVTLEALIDKLGGFLSPYLGDIIKLMVLHPKYVSEVDKNLKSKANAIRKLLTDKIPVRLTLQPLLRIYDEAVSSGDASFVITFDMLEDLIVKMGGPSISGSHAKIFDQCLLALDIRRQSPQAIQNIDGAEKSVINTIVSLTKKLTESRFKPLFIKSIEWTESDTVDSSGNENKSIDRAISFYGLVDRLCDSHRSIFVPYFKYLLDGIVSHLTTAEASVSTRKKKKAKIQETNDTITPKTWHLRALVLSSLKNCFLHDTGSLKFLDANNFQVLLKPIVSQLVVEPPSSLEEHPQVPSVDEVDELVVSCIGQMAVASGSDLLWKQLNHEVLMQTRSEKLRSRILSLRCVKEMLDKLKEEYLVLLAETIPFLGELLEDVEPSVKSLAQDIIKQMEELSGENLAIYL